MNTDITHDQIRAKIKKLEWQTYNDPNFHYSLQAIDWSYKIKTDSHKLWFCYVNGDAFDGRSGVAFTLDEAKALCQTHYEELVLKAFE